MTELSHLDISQSSTLSAGNMQPTPVSVSSGDVGERHEGLLVSIAGTCSNHDIGHGEWMLDDGSGAVVVDDMLFSAEEAPLYNMRYSVIGIGYYSYGSYKVEAIQISMDGQGNLDGPEAPPPPPPPPPPVSTADQCPDPPTALFDHRSSPDILRIGTMNAEWLFDGVDDPSPSPWHAGSTDCGLASGLNQCNEAGATAHLLRVAEVVERRRRYTEFGRSGRLRNSTASC